jgi:hypothetical protein
MVPEGSSPFSQETATGPYPEADESTGTYFRHLTANDQ